MRAIRLPLRLGMVMGFIGLFPVAASAQLKDAQDKGWSTLKDGYGLVASMSDNKSNRTRDNFETALSKVMTSMADMSPYIDKMGERVADEDKSYASGIKDGVRSAWRNVSDAHEKTKRAYDAAKDSPEKMAEISDELKQLKSALEAYEAVCKGAYGNYKARWDDIQKEREKADSTMKSAREKVSSLDKQHDALVKDEKSLTAELNKANEENAKIDKAVDDMLIRKDSIKEKMYKAYDDGKADDYKRSVEEYNKLMELNHQIIKLRIATLNKLEKLDNQLWHNEEDRDKVAKEIDSAMEQMSKVEPLKIMQRFSLWDAEFPAKSYSFQSLK